MTSSGRSVCGFCIDIHLRKGAGLVASVVRIDRCTICVGVGDIYDGIALRIIDVSECLQLTLLLRFLL